LRRWVTGSAKRWHGHPPRFPGSTTSLLERTGEQIPGEERIEAAAGQAELLGGLSRRQSEQPEGSQHMPDEGRCMAIG